MEIKKTDITPIFIVGMNGSGTTMLADCINNHPAIYIHKVETRIIPYYYFMPTRYGNLNIQENFDDLLFEFSNSYAFRVRNNGAPIDIQYDFSTISKKNLSTIIDMTFNFFAAQENKKIWGDHSPKYAAFIPCLIDLFPNSKIVHIIRDGRDCAVSFKRRFRQNIYRSIFQWKDLVTKARKDGIKLGDRHYFEIKYEELTNNPEFHLKNLFDFLEVPFDEKVLISNMPMFGENDTFVDLINTHSIVPNSEKWRKILKPKEINKIEKIAGALLNNLGYEVKNTHGNEDINRSQLFFLKIIDKINASVAFYKRYKGPKKFRTFLQGIATSFKQNKFYQ